MHPRKKAQSAKPQKEYHHSQPFWEDTFLFVQAMAV